MKNPCKDASLIDKGIEWVSLIFGFIVFGIFINSTYIFFITFASYLIFKNIWFYLNKRFLKFPEKIGMGVSEKAELWCQKTMQISSKDYALHLNASQKRRDISFALSLMLSSPIIMILCFSLLPHKMEYEILFGGSSMIFVFGYIVGFAYGAWKYRHVEKPQEVDSGTNNVDHVPYYGLTGDLGEAIVLASSPSRR